MEESRGKRERGKEVNRERRKEGKRREGRTILLGRTGSIFSYSKRVTRGAVDPILISLITI
jgi:hypothetical protein